MTMAGFRAAIWSGRHCNACSPISGPAGSTSWSSTRSTASPGRSPILLGWSRSSTRRLASFVSVTQQFNTTSSMGRLTLNVLLSFAQFEREVTGERIRDKIAASKKKGMWMGGNVPLGYDASDSTLVINRGEAETVRRIFALYREFGCVRRVKDEADCLGLETKRRTTASGAERGGKAFSRGTSIGCWRTRFTLVR